MADSSDLMAGLNAGADAAFSQGRANAKLSGAAQTDPVAARKAAEDFEVTFISQMMQQMFSGVKTDAMFGGGHGEEMFRSVLLDEYSKQIVHSGGFGIADQVMNTLLANQEKGS